MIPFGGIAKLDSSQQYNLHLEVAFKRKDKQHTNSGASLVHLSQL